VQDKALEDGLAKLSEKPAEEDKTNDKLSLAKDNDDELLPKAKVHPVPKFPKWQRKRGGRNNRRKAKVPEKTKKKTLQIPRQEAIKLLDKVAIYMCNSCQKPYCGGRVECAREVEIHKSLLTCHACTWNKVAGDHKCLKHGVEHAMFKCDSCCNIATYDCIYNHFCDRCHSMPSQPKHFPCPGPEKCPLGMPHPNNLPAVHGGPESFIQPFVIGCMACFGATDVKNDLHQGGYVFGNDDAKKGNNQKKKSDNQKNKKSPVVLGLRPWRFPRNAKPFDQRRPALFGRNQLHKDVALRPQIAGKGRVGIKAAEGRQRRGIVAERVGLVGPQPKNTIPFSNKASLLVRRQPKLKMLRRNMNMKQRQTGMRGKGVKNVDGGAAVAVGKKDSLEKKEKKAIDDTASSGPQQGPGPQLPRKGRSVTPPPSRQTRRRQPWR